MTRPESEARLIRVATALGDLLDEVTFIGGAIAPLLHVDSPFDRPRPTVDVDAVIGTSSYAAVGRLHERLRARGFRQDPSTPHHVHRWVSPARDLLDLVPTGDHLGGTGQCWEALAISTAQPCSIAGGPTIRHASAPAFLALKWAAFGDRGAGDPLVSHDLEDILSLVASRPSVEAELRAAPEEVARYVADGFRALRARRDFDDLLGAHLNNAQDAAAVRRRVRERITRIVEAGDAPESE